MFLPLESFFQDQPKGKFCTFHPYEDDRSRKAYVNFPPGAVAFVSRRENGRLVGKFVFDPKEADEHSKTDFVWRT